MAYYPSQGSAYAAPPQPQLMYPPSAGYQPTQYATSNGYYPQPMQELIVPTQGSHHSHRSHHSHHGHRHHHRSHSPTVYASAGPAPMQPSYVSDYGHRHHHYHLSFWEHLRRFFGLAPRGPFKYRSNRGTWGFMGFSRRQRYADPMTGAEVDRKGRPVYRV